MYSDVLFFEGILCTLDGAKASIRAQTHYESCQDEISCKRFPANLVHLNTEKDIFQLRKPQKYTRRLRSSEIYIYEAHVDSLKENARNDIGKFGLA